MLTLPDDDHAAGLVLTADPARCLLLYPRAQWEPIQARLLRKGYVKIAGGFLFGKDRYVFADQIASVDNDVVKLTVNKEGLTV